MATKAGDAPFFSNLEGVEEITGSAPLKKFETKGKRDRERSKGRVDTDPFRQW